MNTELLCMWHWEQVFVGHVTTCWISIRMFSWTSWYSILITINGCTMLLDCLRCHQNNIFLYLFCMVFLWNVIDIRLLDRIFVTVNGFFSPNLPHSSSIIDISLIQWISWCIWWSFACALHIPLALAAAMIYCDLAKNGLILSIF